MSPAASAPSAGTCPLSLQPPASFLGGQRFDSTAEASLRPGCGGTAAAARGPDRDVASGALPSHPPTEALKAKSDHVPLLQCLKGLSRHRGRARPSSDPQCSPYTQTSACACERARTHTHLHTLYLEPVKCSPFLGSLYLLFPLPGRHLPPPVWLPPSPPASSVTSPGATLAGLQWTLLCPT